MALKSAEKPEEAPAVANPHANTTVLELALYKIYTWQGVTYERGKPYRFKNSDAMILLGEHDHGRPVWRIYTPPTKKSAPRNEIVDATRVQAQLPVDEFGTVLVAPDTTKKRIDVGTDDEISDILSRPDDGGDVTV